MTDVPALRVEYRGDGWHAVRPDGASKRLGGLLFDGPFEFTGNLVPSRWIATRRCSGRIHLRILRHGATWRPDLPCCDCRTATARTEYYMVNDTVWAAAGMPVGAGILCIGCLEQRLGRQLIATDFTNCPANDLADPRRPRSNRFIDRLSRTAVAA
ncbi:hypothetical protein [Streptomyces odontomachi]|uniref:hypothetical protein n=1 Tax=Streptomyces odontomachi TaxID=2944940 RepID=UPI00210D28CC|nr:hypothetical protein [Streptomyces sp. ODS25]